MVEKRMYRTHVIGEVENAALVLSPISKILFNSRNTLASLQ